MENRNTFLGLDRKFVKLFHKIMLIAILHSSLVAPSQQLITDYINYKDNRIYYLGSQLKFSNYDNELNNIKKIVENYYSQSKDNLVKTSFNNKTKENIKINSLYFSSDIREGVIGVSSENPFDDPSDNLFKINIDKFPTNETKVFLTYDVYGIHDFQGVARSINNRPSTGGYLVKKIPGWTSQKEEINIEWLTHGINHVFFSIPKGFNHNYRIKNLAIKFENNTSLLPKLVITNPVINYVKDNQFYIKGFIRNYNNKDTKILIEDQLLNINDGEFEGIYNLSESVKQRKILVLKAVDESGLLGQEIIMLDNLYEADKIVKIENIKERVEKLFKRNEQNYLKCDGASIFIRDTSSLCEDRNINISKLRSVDIAPLSSGMINVTKDGSGFRFLPDATTFNKPVELIIDYDERLIPEGYSPNDIKTFYFDTNIKNWIPIKRDTINHETKSIVSLTTHFTDYINGIIQTPESPETAAFTPTMMNDIKAADPSSEITLINPPQASQKGEANISYPIKIPSGRLGMQPNLVVQYNSDAGNGWLGEGWDINMPAITIDTKWGVPTFNSDFESEIYNLNGEQLMYPKITNLDNELVDWMPNRHYDANSNSTVPSTADRGRITNAVFTPRKQGSFAKIERMGNNPTQYYWKVTDTNGTINWYGGSTTAEVTAGNALLRDDNNNIVHWGLFKTQDKYGNTIKYIYNKQLMSGLSGNNENLNGGIYFHIKDILYNGFNDARYGYKVEFSTTTSIREDVNINARLGIKQVTPYFLNQIIVKRSLNPNNPNPVYGASIRKYNFETDSNGVFNKGRLLSIAELNGSDVEFYRHTFEYYNDVGKDNRIVMYGQPYIVSTPSMSPYFAAGFIGNITSRVNSSQNIETEWGATPAAGLELFWVTGNPASIYTIGAPFGESKSKGTGVLTLCDMNGDGLDDLLVKTSEGLRYYKHYKDGNGMDQFSSISNNINNINNFQKTNGWTKTMFGESWNLELFYKFYAGTKRFKSSNNTEVYMTDGNSDGLLDIVANDRVFFNTIESDGNINYTADSTNTPNMLISGNATALTEVEDAFPENSTNDYDVVRVWEAPINMTIKITDEFTFIPLNQDSNVQYSIETRNPNLNGNLPFRIYNKVFDFNNTTENILLTSYGSNPMYQLGIPLEIESGNLNIVQGQKFYFRLHKNRNQNNDILISNPKIWEINSTSSSSNLDQNFLEIEKYEYQNDFIMSGIDYATITSSGSGTISWSSFTVPSLSDNIRIKILKLVTNFNSSPIEEEIFNTTYNTNGNSITISDAFFNFNILETPQYGSSILYKFSVESDSNVNWKQINWKPILSFTPSDVTNTSFTKYIVPKYSIFQIADKSIMSNDFILEDKTKCEGSSWNLLPSSTYKVIPNTYVSANTNLINGNFLFVVKMNGVFIGKRTLTINDNTIVLDNPIPIDFHTGTVNSSNPPKITCEFYVDSSSNLNAFRTYITTVASNCYGNVIIANNNEWASNNENPYFSISDNSNFYRFTTGVYQNLKSHLGNMHRGWGQFLYNACANVKRTDAPCFQNNLLIDDTIVENPYPANIYTTSNNISENCQNAQDPVQCTLDQLNSTIQTPAEGTIDENMSFEEMGTLISELQTQPNTSQTPTFPLISMRPYRNFEDNKYNEKWVGLTDQQYSSSNKMRNNSGTDISEIDIQYTDDISTPTITGSQDTGMIALTKNNRSVSRSYNIGWGSIGLSTSNSSYSVETKDFIDMNGDGYPDHLSTNQIKYTRMTGAHSNPIWHSWSDPNSSQNITAALVASKSFTNSGRKSVSDPNGEQDTAESEVGEQNNTDIGNPSISINLGANIHLGGGSKEKDFWLDINGDGLPDKISNFNSVQFSNGKTINTNPFQSFNLINSNQTYPSRLSGSIGFGISESLGGGFGFSLSAGASINGTKSNVSLQDLNGDNLVDLLEVDGGTANVRFNNGNGFSSIQTPLQTNYSTKNLNQSASSSLSGGVSYFYGFPICCWIFPILYLKFGASISGSSNLTVSETDKMFKDFNGDGFADYIEKSGKDIKVYPSIINRTNKLKTVHNPLGGSFTIDYNVQKIDYNNPNPKWTLKSLTINDGFDKDNDGFDIYQKDFVYENGKYDRRERAFYGYETVKVIEGGLDTPYRTTVSKYHNNNYFLNGLVRETYLLKGNNENQKFSKTTNNYALKKLDNTNNAFVEPQVNLPETFDVGGTEGRRSAAVVLTGNTNEYYDLENTNIQIITTNNLVYDKKGNVITYINNGNTLDPSDDYKATITYHNHPTTNATIIAKNIIRVPKLLTVTNTSGSIIYRKRETTIVAASGDISGIRAYHTDTAFTTTKLAYHLYGHLQIITYPDNLNGQMMKYNYGVESNYGKYITSITDSYGYSSTASYDANFDKIVRTREDHTGNVTAYEYDSFGRNTKITGPNEFIASDLSKYTIKFDYYPKFSDLPSNSGIQVGQFVPVAVTKHYDIQNVGNDIETYTFIDGLARPIQIKKDIVLNTGTAQSLIETKAFSITGRVKYDEFGRATEQYHPTSEVSSSTTKFLFNDELGDYSSIIEYDELDRVINSYDPIENGTSNSYTIVDNLSGVSYPLFKTLTSTQQNNTNSIVNETYKDVSGKTIATINIGDVNLQTRFNYNPVGDLVSYTDAETLTTSYEYDLLGRKKTMLSPDSGLTTYAYDNANHITSVQTKNLAQNTSLPSANRFIKYNYNFNQLLSITYPPNANGTTNISNVTYTYGTISGNNRGRIVSQTDATGSQTFNYGKMGEVVSNTRTVVGPNIPTRTFTTKYKYDSWNRLQELEYPDREKVTFKYDLGGNLNKVTGTLNGAPYDYIKRIDYDQYEQRTYLKYGNNTETFYTYTPELRRLSNLNVKTSSQVAIFNNNYQYDYVGNVTSLVNNATSTDLGGSYSHTYTYDKFNRLKTALGNFQGSQAQQTAGNDYSSDYDLEMEYNNTHGITKKIQRHYKNNNVYVPNTFINNYDYHANSHKVKEITDDAYGISEIFEHDHNGNLVRRAKSTGEQRNFIWDESNRLRVVADATTMQNYIYDASGERVLKANTSTTTVYQNGTLVSPSTTTINGYTTYPSGFIVVDPLGNYTKHYYAGSQRIVSRFVGSASIFTNNSAARTSESPTLDDKKLQKEQKADLQRFLEKASIGKPIYKDFKPYSYEEVNKLLAENEKDKTESDTNVSSAAPEPPVTINTVYYYHPDHLGTSTFLTDYYGAKYQFFLNLPFGETMAEQLPSTYYKTPYKFNGKELDEETGLYYYGARYYDPRISIWLSVDPLAEQTPHVSPYAFCLNNPIRYNDPTGMSAEDPLDYYNNSGDRVGTDGVNDGRKAVVTDNSEARAIKRTDRDGGTTALSTVSSAVVLPSDAVLQESLNVLDRAVQNGGQREESSLVLNNGSVLRGQTGPEPTVTNGVQTAPSTLPALPAGTTTADVEATIHSHPITVPQVGNQVFPQSASVPSTGPGSDGPTFAQYNTNIIVGPLGTVTNVTQNPNGTLNIPNRPNGAAIYNRDSTPRVELKQRTIEKILSPRQ